MTFWYGYYKTADTTAEMVAMNDDSFEIDVLFKRNVLKMDKPSCIGGVTYGFDDVIECRCGYGKKENPESYFMLIPIDTEKMDYIYNEIKDTLHMPIPAMLLNLTQS